MTIFSLKTGKQDFKVLVLRMRYGRIKISLDSDELHSKLSFLHSLFETLNTISLL